MAFNENLKKIRQERGLSQLDLANEALVTQAAIVFFETGTKSPKPDTIGRLADALGVTCDKLIKGEPIEDRKEYNHAKSKVKQVAGNKENV